MMKAQPPIAIIGMAGRFPDAPDIHEFWRNLEQGHESLISFSDAELLESGIPPELLQNPNYVKKGTVCAGSELFDAGFFGFNPREAELMDPQHRIFLECAWQAMEDAGYSGDQSNASVGVYAGSSMNTYVFSNLLQNPEVLQAAGGYQVMLANDKDFLATRVSYKLNLKGPSLTVQTACSTSLVAVQVACQALLAHQCEMALAGAVSAHFPENVGHLYDEGMIFSKDGRCRPFDAAASGIRAGAGAAVIVLKRLDDALRDGDTVRAVILGAAINNDGAAKMGYTAPSVDGQAEAISMALRQGGVDPSTVTYVEAHGTGTRVGDPIEIAALERVFRTSTQKKQFCAIGSVKSNIGHLDTAAGIAGLIKTVLALQHKRIPASLGFETPNPLIDFANSPFYVNGKSASWPSDTPRRAGVSSFGIGGTNAHVVLEEAPVQEQPATHWPAHALVLSAKTASALESLTQQTETYLRANPDVCWADVCYTSQLGRKTFPHRRALVSATREEAIDSLANRRDVRTQSGALGNPSVTFMFTGQGSQHLGMARGLYQTQPTFRKWFDVCAASLQNGSGCDLKELLYSASADATALNQTRMAQVALFAVEYSLARMWMSWGVQPDTMIGHSIGEFVAACLAGVFSLEDGLRLVETRGRIMQQMPAGSMLAVALPYEQLRNMLNKELSLAAVNAPSLCTVSGPSAAIQNLLAQLQVSGVECRALHTSHAFHSSMMDGAIEPFIECFRSVKLNAPRIPFVSNLTGTYIRPEDATNPSYWATHLRQTVKFADGIRELATEPGRIFLEVGPGQTLSTFARDTVRGKKGFETFSSLPQPKESQSDLPFVLNTVARLWLAGIPIDWNGVHEGERLHRIPLPTYPFERQSYWVQPKSGVLSSTLGVEPLARKNIDDWFYSPSWTRTVLPSSVVQPENRGPWLIFKDRSGLADRIVKELSLRGERFATVDAADGFASHGDSAYGINPSRTEDYQRLLRELQSLSLTPRSILYLWGMPGSVAGGGRAQFHSLLRLAQALGGGPGGLTDWIVVSAGMHRVTGSEAVDPEQALLLGPVKVIPTESPNLICRSIDLPESLAPEQLSTIAENLLLEPGMPRASQIVAYRDGNRWQQSYMPVPLRARDRDPIRHQGVYLITGGTGGIGLTVAAYLAQNFQARLALTCRSAIPPRGEWQQWIESHDPADRTSEILQAVKRLESLGAEVLLLTADVADRAAMSRAVSEIHAHFGKVNGVIHAAGIAIGGLVQLKTQDSAERVLIPKVDGTVILDSLLVGDSLDFFLLCSSINAICGVAGAVDYTAANAFLDAFATSLQGKGRGIVASLNWDTWQEVGMAANTVVPQDMVEGWKKNLATGIRPAEGIEAFRRALGAGIPQVAIITRDLERLIAETEKYLEFSRSGAASDTSTKPNVEELGHARPGLDVAYVEPTTDAQKKIVAIWKELLGIAEIGIDDNFFELGGHSLLATRVLSRVVNTFGLVVPIQAVFDAPTIRSFADHVEILLWATTKPRGGDSDTREEVEI